MALRRLLNELFKSIGSILGAVAAPFTGGASLLPSLISGGASLVGSIMQNNSAKSIANNNNAQAIELANTAHQREVADLKAAGLNPILSAGGSGSSTPSLQAAPVQNVLGGAAASALQAATLKANLDNIREDTALKREQQAQVRENTQTTVADYWVKAAQRDQILAQTSSAQSRAAIDALDAKSALDMGAITKNIERGSTTAASVINMVKLMSQLMRGSPASSH